MLGNYNFGSYGWVYPILIWSMFWKGLALWKSAKEDNKYWFLALLIINTVGLLELSYLFVFAKEKLTLRKLKNLIGFPTKTKK